VCRNAAVAKPLPCRQVEAAVAHRCEDVGVPRRIDDDRRRPVVLRARTHHRRTAMSICSITSGCVAPLATVFTNGYRLAMSSWNGAMPSEAIVSTCSGSF